MFCINNIGKSFIGMGYRFTEMGLFGCILYLFAYLYNYLLYLNPKTKRNDKPPQTRKPKC